MGFIIHAVNSKHPTASSPPPPPVNAILPVTNNATNSSRHLQGPSQQSQIFQHGVASFDPTPSAVIIWSRVSLSSHTNTATNGNSTVSVRWQMTTFSSFSAIVASGTTHTSADQDYTVRVDVTGLDPYTFYYYRFTYCFSPNQHCVDSMTGRTKTAPSKVSSSTEAGARGRSNQKQQQLRFATVSCSSYQWGWFHAYDQIYERNDVDAVIHLGDYIYDNEPSDDKPRVHDPPRSTVTLEDYRTRYAQYRREPSLQRLHQRFAFVTTWDDHEFTNNAWRDGAGNHDPATQGPWEARRQAASQAYFEWLPFRQATQTISTKTPYNLYRKLEYGDLVDLFILDSRIAGRDAQRGAFQGGQAMFLPTYYDSDHDLLGETQMAWLKKGLAQSEAQWKVVVQTVLVAPMSVAGLFSVSNDKWDGYQADRAELMGHIVDHHIDNVVILTGDLHATVVADIPQEKTADLDTWADWFFHFPRALITPAYTSIAVEFLVTAVSAGKLLETSFLNSIPFCFNIVVDFLGVPVVAWMNPHLRYIDALNHGYQVIDFQQGRVQGDIYFTGSPREETDDRPVKNRYQRSYFSLHGENTLQLSHKESSPLDDGSTYFGS